jgi:hypothetical protein
MIEAPVLERRPADTAHIGTMIVSVLRRKLEGSLRYAPPKRISHHHKWENGALVNFDDPDLALAFTIGGAHTAFSDRDLNVVLAANGNVAYGKQNAAAGPMFGPQRSLIEMRRIRALQLPGSSNSPGQLETWAGPYRALDGLQQANIFAGALALAGDSETVNWSNVVNGCKDTDSSMGMAIWQSEALALTGDQLNYR